jgi:hypothetical protein
MHRVHQLTGHLSAMPVPGATATTVTAAAGAVNVNVTAGKARRAIDDDGVYVLGACRTACGGYGGSLANQSGRECECTCDFHLCSLLCCSVGSASALVTFISCSLHSARANPTINMQLYTLQ